MKMSAKAPSTVPGTQVLPINVNFPAFKIDLISSSIWSKWVTTEDSTAPFRCTWLALCCSVPCRSLSGQQLGKKSHAFQTGVTEVISYFMGPLCVGFQLHGKGSSREPTLHQRWAPQAALFLPPSLPSPTTRRTCSRTFLATGSTLPRRGLHLSGGRTSFAGPGKGVFYFNVLCLLLLKSRTERWTYFSFLRKWDLIQYLSIWLNSDFNLRRSLSNSGKHVMHYWHTLKICGMNTHIWKLTLQVPGEGSGVICQWFLLTTWIKWLL